MSGFLTRMISDPGLDDRYYSSLEGASLVSGTGVPVTADFALRVSAVWRCVTLLSSTMAALPLITYRYVDNDGRERARQHPLNDVLANQPNTWQDGFQFRELMLAHLLLRGNFYALIVPGPRGFADQLVPLNPDRVKVEVGDDRLPVYRVRPRDGGAPETFLDDEIFHVRGFGTDGYKGLSIIGLAADTIGLGRTYDEYATGLFRHGAQPPGVLTHQKTLSKIARKNLRRSIRQNYGSGHDYGRWLILEEGMKYEKIGMTNADAEFLASRKFTITEIARWFGVPPHKIADLDRSTNNNIEHQGIEWVVDGVLPWARRIEAAIGRQLILAPDIYFTEFLLQGLLRGDTKSRYEAYALGIQWGWLSPNDVRRLENLNPIPGGDVYLRPMNMAPIGTNGQPAPGAYAHIDSDGKVLQLPTPATSRQLSALATDAAARVVRREVAAMRKLLDRTGEDASAWEAGVDAFYADHARYVAEAMRIGESDARQWARDQRDELVAEGPMVLDRWESERAERLAEICILQEVTAA